jgi:hypothetical protein
VAGPKVDETAASPKHTDQPCGSVTSRTGVTLLARVRDFLLWYLRGNVRGAVGSMRHSGHSGQPKLVALVTAIMG